MNGSGDAAPRPVTDERDPRALALELRARGVPFVLATVVRAERPTSAKPGDCAVVLADGKVAGFVGGTCAMASVRLEALRALQRATPVLVRVAPDGASARAEPGVVAVENACVSGGTLEIFLEPVLPPDRLVVHGDAPIAQALAQVGRAAGFAVDLVPAEAPSPELAGALAVVVATHGSNELALLDAALRAKVPYVGLVASRRRAASVLAELDDEQRERVRSPAGLALGARRPGPIAVSILAEIIQVAQAAERDDDAPGPLGNDTAPLDVAEDPVCGMSVAAVEASLHVCVGDEVVYFCGSGCQAAFVADPERYLASRTHLASH